MNFFSLLTLVFIVLKLTNAISWSWWWVLSPLWILGVFAVGCAIVETWLEEREKKERYEAFKKTGY